MNDEWRGDAACKGKPIRWWFPEQGDTTQAGKAVCARCPVLTECGDYAASASETSGIWAGVLLDVRRSHSRKTIRVKDRVLAELKSHGRQWVSVAMLSSLTGINKESVSRALRELSEVEQMEHERGGYWRLVG